VRKDFSFTPDDILYWMFMTVFFFFFEKFLGWTTILINNELFRATTFRLRRKLRHYIIIISKVFLFLFSRVLPKQKISIHPKDSREFLNLKKSFSSPVCHLWNSSSNAGWRNFIPHLGATRSIKWNRKKFCGETSSTGRKKMIKKVFLVFHVSN